MAVLKGTSGANKLVGTSLADTISGLAGNGTILGNAGNDTLLGGDGTDILDGGEGNDTLKGAKGNHTLKGGGGADKMFGGAGNDKYYVDSTGDRVSEGTFRDKGDTIYTTITINAATSAFGAGQIEQVRILGTSKVNVTANTGNNALVGNSAANVLKGGAGNDKLMGGGGADILYAGSGNDRLDGGAGNDLLVAIDGDLVTAAGGSGIDTLRFTGSNLSLDFGIVSSVGLGALAEIAAPTDSVSASGLEVIDIRGGGANRLNLDRTTADGINTSGKLTIVADSNDTVTLGFNLDPAGTTTEGGVTFDVFTGGGITVLVPQTAIPHLDGPILDAAILDGFVGFRLDGMASDDLTGNSVASAGDINGDGFEDFIVGAYLSDAQGGVRTNAGAAYVVFGAASGIPASIDLSTLNGSNGFRVDGAKIGDGLGASVASAGDINGDGFSDLIFGAPYADIDVLDDGKGGAFVLFGKGSPFGAVIDLSGLGAADGFRLDGAGDADTAGFSVASIGDVNGDGIDDMIIGAEGADPDAVSNAGAAYVVFGKTSSFGTSFDLASLDGSNGFRLDGHFKDDNVRSVASAGDVNGDGIADIIVGAHVADPAGSASGAAYLVFGKTSSFGASFDLSTLDKTTGYRFDGQFAGDIAGYSVASAGDIDGDGFDDLIIGAVGAASSGIFTGAAYVVFGGATNLDFLDSLDGTPGDGKIDLSELNGSKGFRLDGVATNDVTGESVASAGDVNGDGYFDLIVGARLANGGGINAGAAYVLFGGAGGFAPVIDLSTLDGTTGFRIDGVLSEDRLGASVSAAGDIDGDGFDDLIVGATGADPGGTDSGAAYVIYGNDFRLEATKIGTEGADTINGTAGDDILNGAQGNDTINGLTGFDVINGGSGNDSIHVNATVAGQGEFFRIDGGGGVDTLFIDYAGKVDFSNWDSNPDSVDRGKIAGIEAVDVDNGLANTLTIHKADLLDLDCQVKAALNTVGLANVLIIEGDGGDTLTLASGEGWIKSGSFGSLYDIYSSGNVRFAVDTDIAVLPFTP